MLTDDLIRASLGDHSLKMEGAKEIWQTGDLSLPADPLRPRKDVSLVYLAISSPSVTSRLGGHDRRHPLRKAAMSPSYAPDQREK